MSNQRWMETLIEAQADGAALTNTITATSLLPTPAVYTLPSNFFNVIGKKLRIFAMGRMSTVATTPGTFTFDVRFGSTVVWTGGAMALNTTAQTNDTWTLELDLTCRAIGSGSVSTLLGIGYFCSAAVIGSPAPSAGGSGSLLLPATAPAVGTGFDCTATQAVNLFGTWSVANASNSITLHQYSLESLN